MASMNAHPNPAALYHRERPHLVRHVRAPLEVRRCNRGVKRVEPGYHFSRPHRELDDDTQRERQQLVEGAHRAPPVRARLP